MDKFQVDGTSVYLPRGAGGFNVSLCPDPFNLARRTGASLNVCRNVKLETLESLPPQGPLYCQELIETKARVAELLIALRKFGLHKIDCAAGINDRIHPCSCGLSKAILDAIG